MAGMEVSEVVEMGASEVVEAGAIEVAEVVVLCATSASRRVGPDVRLPYPHPRVCFS